MKESAKILLVNLLYMGDLIFTTPFIRNLRQIQPKAKIDLVVNGVFADILSANPYLDEVYPYDKGAGPLYGLRFARRLRKEGYDLGLNLHGNERSRLLLKLIRPTQSFTFKNNYPGRHMVEAYLAFLEDLTGCPAKDRHLEILMDPSEGAPCLRTKDDEKILALNVGASWPTKQWTTEGFAQVADGLIQLGYKVIFLGSKIDNEKVAEILKEMEEKPWQVLTGKTNLKELATVLQQCNLLLSGDTGPLHLASALGVPVVAIFGPSDKDKYQPWTADYRLVKTDLPCQPCGLHQCSHHSCMEEIKAKEVLKVIMELMEGEG